MIIIEKVKKVFNPSKRSIIRDIRIHYTACFFNPSKRSPERARERVTSRRRFCVESIKQRWGKEKKKYYRKRERKKEKRFNFKLLVISDWFLRNHQRGFRDILVLLLSRDSGKSKSPRNLLVTIFFSKIFALPFSLKKKKKKKLLFASQFFVKYALSRVGFLLPLTNRVLGGGVIWVYFFFDVVFGFW